MTTAPTPLRPSRSALTAERVRGLLAERGMTYKNLGEALGLSTAAVSDRLRGRTKIDIDELDDLVAIFGVRLEYILGISDVRGTPATPVSARIPGGEPNIADVAFLVQPEINDGQPVSAGLVRLVRHQGLEPRTRCFDDQGSTEARDAGEVTWATVLPFRRRGGVPAVRQSA